MQRLDKIYSQVPPGYYYQSIAHNIFQKFWHFQRFKQIKKTLRNKSGKLLDIGCADGVFTNEISKYLRQPYQIYAVDIYKPAINFAKSKFPHIKFINSSAENLPFGNKQFDYITSLEVLEHVVNPQQVINEIKRVIKQNGKIIILVPNETILFKIIWWIWTKFKGKVWNHSHLHHYTDKKLEKLFNINGFKIIKRNKFLFNMLIMFLLKSD